MKGIKILLGVILCWPHLALAQAFLNTTSDQILKRGNMSATLKSSFLKNTIAPDYIHSADHVIYGPSAYLTLGLGPGSEFEIDWDMMRFIKVHQGKSTADVSDISFFTKIRLLEENIFPSFSIRVGAKLPNASNETYAGTDKTDIFMYSIFGKQFEKLHLFTNLGLELLGHPDNLHGQNDVFGYGVACSYALRDQWIGSFEFWGRRDTHWDSPLNQALLKDEFKEEGIGGADGFDDAVLS